MSALPVTTRLSISTIARLYGPEAHDNFPHGIQLYYEPNMRKADYRAALAFFDRAIFSIDPNYAAPMRGEALHLESFIWLAFASDGWKWSGRWESNPSILP